jgi:hypothetical protein
MQIENNKEEVPFSYYAELFAKADPVEIASRLGLPFENGAFKLTLLGKTYTIPHPVGDDAQIVPDCAIPVQTFLLRYLLEAKTVAWKGEWKTFREMPWGELYIKPYTGRVLTRAAFTFGMKVEKFRAACEKLGAAPLKHGDAGFEFDFIGGYKMRVLVWAADEEFPPNAQVLYSDNFAEGFAAEDRVVAGDILISHIKAAM